MAELRVSELPTAVTLGDSDLLLLSQPDENSDTGYASAKTTNVALATKVAKGTDFGDLQTTSKKIIGAINELKGEVGAQDLADLDDVNVTTPATGECLQYNGTSQKWENKDILAVNETTLTEPYVYKQVPNGKYTEKLKKLIGASVVWNQILNNFTNRSETLGITITVNNDGSITVSGTATSTNNLYFKSVITFKKDHIYLLRGSKSNTANHGLLVVNYNFKDTGNGVVFKMGVDTNNGQIGYFFTQGDVLDERVYPQLTDLTEMFGSTIADYVNTLETTEAGSGIAWLQKYGFFTEDYYAYSANTIQSVSVSKHITKDSERQTLTETTLDHTTLRGLFKLDANNNLYADGDIYNADGSGIVNIANDDFGNLTWTRSTSYTNPFFYTSLPNRITGANVQFLQDVYNVDSTNTTSNNFGNNAENKSITFSSNSNQVFVRDDTYTDATTFKTALTGKKLCYKKTTPTSATLTPFNELSALENGGAEEFIDYGVQQGTRDVAIPCGNESVYGDNRLMGEIIKYINN